MKKPSEFLSELDSHGIYNAKGLAEDFRQETGYESCWTTHAVEQTQLNIAKHNCGGFINSDGPVAYGWEIAEAVSQSLVPDENRQAFFGRGRIFRQAVEILAKAGF